jgi:hypothetical protein
MKSRKYMCSIVMGAVLTLPLFGGCDQLTAKRLATIDITGAAQLFIAPALGSGAQAKNRLHKITSTGNIEEAACYDRRGRKIAFRLAPAVAAHVNEDYAVACFGQQFGYLIRKSDGAAFSLAGAGIPSSNMQWGNFANIQKIQFDGDGFIYYEIPLGNGYSKVVKVDISDPENIAAVDSISDNDSLTSFNVTPEGHVAYTYAGGNKTRIRKTNGQLYDLPDLTWLPHWVGLDGKVKYVYSDKVVTVFIDPDTFSVTTSEAAGTLGFSQGINKYILNCGSRTIVADNLNDTITEVESPSGTPRIIPKSGIEDIKHAAASSSFYYLSGADSSQQPLLLKINPSDDSVTTLLAPGLYDIDLLTVDADDLVTFSATRVADGAKQIAQISAAGQLIILETYQRNLVVLEQLN